MRDAKWPFRLAIVLSGIWVVIAYALSYEENRFSGSSFAILVLPVVVLWGIGWVVAGMLRNRKQPAAALAGMPSAMLTDAPAVASAPDLADVGEAAAVDKAWEPAVAVPPVAGPWRRFLARTLDVYVWCVVIGFVIGLVNVRYGWSLLNFKGMPTSTQDMLAGVLIIPFALLCDVLVFAMFGNTIGKGLLGVKVEKLDGTPLPAQTFALRTVDVWWRGLGVGIPIVAFFTEIAGYRALSGGKRTSWDIRYGCRVSKVSRKIGHYLVALVLFVCVLAAYGYGKMLEDREAAAQNQPPVTWVNPVSNASAVVLPAGWSLLPPTTKLPPNTWLFVDASGQYVAGIGFEATDMPLSDYVDALMKGNPTLALIRNGGFIGEGTGQVWAGSGAGVAAGQTDALTVQAHVFPGNGGFWRVFVAAPRGRDDGRAIEADLYRSVLQTAGQ